MAMAVRTIKFALLGAKRCCWREEWKYLFQGQNFDIITRRILQVTRAGPVPMFARLSIVRRLAEHGKVRRVLVWKNKCQADIGKFNERPRLVLIVDLTVKILRVPIDGFLDVGNGDRHMVHRIQFLFVLQFGHFLTPRPTKSSEPVWVITCAHPTATVTSRF